MSEESPETEPRVMCVTFTVKDPRTDEVLREEKRVSGYQVVVEREANGLMAAIAAKDVANRWYADLSNQDADGALGVSDWPAVEAAGPNLRRTEK